MAAPATTPTGVRLPEIVTALSLAIDLGLGLPLEHVQRQTMIAMRLSDCAGGTPADRTACFYTSMLAWVGCTADSHELARLFGDDIAIRAATYDVDMAGAPLLTFVLRNAGRGSPALRRARLVGQLLASRFAEVERALQSHCEATGMFASRLGLGPDVCDALAQALERWDGKGTPGRVAGQELTMTARTVHLADIVEVAHRNGGVTAAVALAETRRGSQFDPGLVDTFRRHAEQVTAGLDEDLWSGLLSLLPPSPPLMAAQLDSVLAVLADFSDLKCPWRLGHSRASATLAGAAARRIGLAEGQVALIVRAALVADLGLIGISNALLDKPGPLSAGERERVATHPFLTERALARPAALVPIARLAGLHHERQDGSGYPHGLAGDAIPLSGRLLAAADTYQAMREARPHRAAYTAAQAAQELRRQAAAGTLDGDVVEAVLEAAGHRGRRRPPRPAGLTGREIEVLRLLARGMSNRRIAQELVISPKTVGTHVEHIYAKIGISTRAALALFAVGNGLIDA